MTTLQVLGGAWAWRPGGAPVLISKGSLPGPTPGIRITADAPKAKITAQSNTQAPKEV